MIFPEVGFGYLPGSPSEIMFGRSSNVRNLFFYQEHPGYFRLQV